MHVEAGADRSARRRRPQAAHRPQPQRSGGPRLATVGARCARPGRRPARWPATGARRRGGAASGSDPSRAIRTCSGRSRSWRAHYFLAYVEKLAARPLAAGRLPQAAERPAPGRGGDGRHDPADRPRLRGAGARVRRRGGEQHGRLQRPRFRDRVGVRADDDRRAPLRLGRGVGDLEHAGVLVPGAARRRLHRLQHHAAEEEPRRLRADPRPLRPGDRGADDPARAGQGPAAGLQPRPAGGQRAALRRLRHRHRLPGAGRRRGGWRDLRADRSPRGSKKASSTRRR